MTTFITVNELGENKFSLTFTSDVFMEVVAEAHSSGIVWDAKGKVWKGGLEQTKMFLVGMESRAEISPAGILLRIKARELVPERKFLKIPFRKSLLAREPLPSKNGGISFQTEDILSGISTNAFAFYLEQGMGKSFISLCVFNHLRTFARVKKLLIVCESAGVFNWRRYIVEECLGDIARKDILIVDASNREDLGTTDHPVRICTFGTFRLCAMHWKKPTVKVPRSSVIPFQGSSEEWMIIVDESQNIGGNSALITKCMLAHKENFEYRYLLSGTPAINSPAKYYTQMKFLDDTIFLKMDYQSFLAKIAIVGTAYSKWQVSSFCKEALPWIHERIAPVCSRRKSEDFLLLPEHDVRKVWCELPPRHHRIYTKILLNDILKRKEIDGYVDTRKVYQKFSTYHLALDNPELIKGLKAAGELDVPQSLEHDLKNFSFATEHGKVVMLRNLLEKYVDEMDEKVVVWSGHPVSIDMLCQTFKKYAPLKIHGKTLSDEGLGKDEYRDQIIEDWKKSETSKVLFLSYFTSSTSINLTQACHQIFFDRSYNAVYFDQAIKRLHRTGQSRSVQTDVLLFEDTLDVRLDKNLSDKREIDNIIFTGGIQLSNEDWATIFTGGFIEK